MRNHFLDGLKFIFIIIISFWHTEWWRDILHHGYLPVEFFFIVSGYFIFLSEKKENTLTFTYKKIKRLFPTYILTLTLYIILYCIAPVFYPDSGNANICISILREATLLSAVGIFELSDIPMISFNGHAWYISTLLYGGIIVFLINRLKKIRIYLFTGVAFVFYIWILFISTKGLNEYWDYESIFFIPLWRGIACMGIGSIIGIINESSLSNKNFQQYSSILNILTALCIVISILCCFLPEDNDWIAILCFIVILINIIQPSGISTYFNKLKYVQLIPDISLEILLIHKFSIIFTSKILTIIGLLDYSIIKSITYIFVNISFAIAIQFIINYYRRSNIVSRLYTINRNVSQ